MESQKRRGHRIATALLMSVAAPLAAPASQLEIQSLNVNSGSQAARLTVDDGCTPGDATVPDGTLSADPGLEPCGALEANDVDVVSGSVTFRAGSEIRLGEGFSVASAAALTVLVDPVAGDAYVRDESPGAETDYYVRFYIDPGGLLLDDDGDRFDHLLAYDAQGSPEFLIGVTYQASLGERRLYATAWGNDGSAHTTQDLCELVLAPSWQYVEAHWRASSGSDGDLELSIDGGPSQSLSQCLALVSGLDNSNGEISAVEWGARNPSSGELGTVDLDDFDSQSTGPIGGL